MLKNKLLSASGAAEEMLAIEDVFSTYLYTGNGSTQTITNGIDLAGEGGLVWIKERNGANWHALCDTSRGAGNLLFSNFADAQLNLSQSVTGFNASGFNLSFAQIVNNSGSTYASWTFRKAPRFFDVVTYTGNGGTQTINHNLGTDVGFIAVKQTSGTNSWGTWDRASGDGRYMSLNTTSAAASITPTVWIYNVDSSSFTTGHDPWSNTSGATYVAYLFAHDPLGPSGDGSDGLIACGSYTGTGARQEINLGWEPQWVMVKAASTTGNWTMLDVMRGWPNNSSDATIYADGSFEEGLTAYGDPSPRGFFTADSGNDNLSGQTYIYIAIRRGPMRPPESGSEVFAAATSTDAKPVQTTGFPVDLGFGRDVRSGQSNFFIDRVRGGSVYLASDTTAAEGSVSSDFASYFDSNTAWTFRLYGVTLPKLLYAFRRAPEFFDVVAYTGNGVAGRTVPHNLGVAPEMMWVKGRSIEQNWVVYNPNGRLQLLNGLAAEYSAAVTDDYFGNGSTVIAPTEAEFTIGTDSAVNSSGNTYIAYLFATLPGVSKVGSYTGNGTSQTIDCGFTTGARFILIKRTDSTGDWYVWDTARGIVAANDPHLSLNTTAAEVTTNDSVDPDSSGFIVNQTATTNVNVSSASYIFMAIS